MARSIDWDLRRVTSSHVLHNLRRAYENAVVSASAPSYIEMTEASWGNVQTSTAEEAAKPLGAQIT